MAGVHVVLVSDVDNPLLGPNGAAAVYGPQKGARPDEVSRLERGLSHWADVVAARTGRDFRDHPGAGAAGGTGFAALALLDADMRSGVDTVLTLVGFDETTRDADLVVTGEGSMDEQTLRGKVPIGVARAAQRLGVPVVAVSGRTTLSSEALREAGFRLSWSLTDREPDLRRCLQNAEELLEDLGGELAREWMMSTSSDNR